MNHTLQNLGLLARNEGKIKSYESCSDLRAWSHDLSAKDRHLREWMKSDMPISVIPISTLTGFLRTMTCRSRRRVAPRCHPDCKSKVLLDSICNSCHAMRECLKRDENLEKFFIEEELETSQWPCERCLEALKSIKIFWKIIVDKIFQINLSKYNESETDCSSGDSLKSVAKVWQNEMVQQAMYVKTTTPKISRVPLFNQDANETSSQTAIKSSLADKRIHVCRSKHINQTKPHTHTGEANSSRSVRKRVSRSTHMEVKTVETGCDTCFLEKEHEEIKAHKRNLQILQNKCNLHVEEVARLNIENNSLRIELENVYKGCPWKPSFFCSGNKHSHTLVPTPFEAAIDDKSDTAKDIDSEMIITMKKCKHENFKHVSLLQVLHKTNEPRIEQMKNRSNCNKENPIEILTKVQNAFGAIVKREMSIVTDRRHGPKKLASEIEATFHKMNSCKSAPSCSTLDSTISSDINFAKEPSDRLLNKITNIYMCA